MKTILMSLLLIGATPAFAYPTACGCHELNRRASGLDYASRYAYVSNNERQQLRQLADRGRAILQQSYSYPTYQHENICSRGTQRLNSMWVRWQPWVAQSGADIGNPCE
jgi:hypothetical protein